jgi:uridine kinase
MTRPSAKLGRTSPPPRGTRTRQQKAHRSRLQPLVVGIVGGSGSGKTWLAERLESVLAGDAARLSADDFYLDRSHLHPAQRARLNFDHPRAIDWAELERAVRQLAAGEAAEVPCYDFRTHCRLKHRKRIKPARLILLDGLWLLRRRALRRLIDIGIFIECPARTRLQRRLSRDLQARGRTRSSVKRQFWRTVEPMHRKYVAPQARRADLVLPASHGPGHFKEIVTLIKPRVISQKARPLYPN